MLSLSLLYCPLVILLCFDPLEKILERGEKLDLLVEKAEDLEASVRNIFVYL